MMDYRLVIRIGARMDIKDIKEYWEKKYPRVDVRLWESKTRQQYYGIMMAANQSIDLCADTLGELIAQGEAFLRKQN
jgi:hypothetical protein